MVEPGSVTVAVSSAGTILGMNVYYCLTKKIKSFKKSFFQVYHSPLLVAHATGTSAILFFGVGLLIGIAIGVAMTVLIQKQFANVVRMLKKV